MVGVRPAIDTVENIDASNAHLLLADQQVGRAGVISCDHDVVVQVRNEQRPPGLDQKKKKKT